MLEWFIIKDNGDLQRYSGCRDGDYAGCPINIPNNNDKICVNVRQTFNECFNSSS